MTTGRTDEALKQSSMENGACLRKPAAAPGPKGPPKGAAKGGANGGAMAGRPRHECGSLDMRIARDGSWHYKGSPIGRKELVCLFASVLQREPDGSYWLETPAERGSIEVEDAPFIAVEVFWRRC